MEFKCPHCGNEGAWRIQSSDDTMDDKEYENLIELWQCGDAKCDGYFLTYYKLYKITKLIEITCSLSTKGVLDPSSTQIRGGVIRTERILNWDGDSYIY